VTLSDSDVPVNVWGRRGDAWEGMGSACVRRSGCPLSFGVRASGGVLVFGRTRIRPSVVLGDVGGGAETVQQ
jgi:hypothetical protein